MIDKKLYRFELSGLDISLFLNERQLEYYKKFFDFLQKYDIEEAKLSVSTLYIRTSGDKRIGDGENWTIENVKAFGVDSVFDILLNSQDCRKLVEDFYKKVERDRIINKLI
jgi:hypothetical protein